MLCYLSLKRVKIKNGCEKRAENMRKLETHPLINPLRYSFLLPNKNSLKSIYPNASSESQKVKSDRLKVFIELLLLASIAKLNQN